jgi:hypothetical protein
VSRSTLEMIILRTMILVMALKLGNHISFYYWLSQVPFHYPLLLPRSPVPDPNQVSRLECTASYLHKGHCSESLEWKYDYFQCRLTQLKGW